MVEGVAAFNASWRKTVHDLQANSIDRAAVNAPVSVDVEGLRRELERQTKERSASISCHGRCTRPTRASIRSEPLGVVVPARATISFVCPVCAEFRCPLTMRGAAPLKPDRRLALASSLTPPSTGSRARAERRRTMGPRGAGHRAGRAELQLKPHGLRFAPDISTASRATIGGMMANNSSGARSVYYGKTTIMLEQEVVLSEGSIVHFRALSPDELTSVLEGETLESNVIAWWGAWRPSHAAEIERRFPKVLRRVGGYNLDEFIRPGRRVNLSRLMVGSEGTLGVVLTAKLNLVPLPRAKAVITIQFADLLESLAATPLILTHRPSAVEVMDHFILDHTRQSPALHALRQTFVEGDPGSLLCVEFYADQESDLPPKLRALERDLRRNGFGYHYHHALDASTQSRIWALREAALGLSMTMKDDAKSLSFVEDTAVAPEKLRDYIKRFLAIIRIMGLGRRLCARVGRLPARATRGESQD